MPIPKKENPLDRQICIRFTQADYEAITTIPDYREKLRLLVRQWLENQNSTGRDES